MKSYLRRSEDLACHCAWRSPGCGQQPIVPAGSVGSLGLSNSTACHMMKWIFRRCSLRYQKQGLSLNINAKMVVTCTGIFQGGADIRLSIIGKQRAFYPIQAPQIHACPTRAPRALVITQGKGREGKGKGKTRKIRKLTLPPLTRRRRLQSTRIRSTSFGERGFQSLASSALPSAQPDRISADGSETPRTTRKASSAQSSAPATIA